MFFRFILSFTIISASVVESFSLNSTPSVQRAINTEYIANKTVSDHHHLPEIRDGQKCETGKTYRMDCNTCYCAKQKLICTKIACINWKPARPKYSNSTLKFSLRNRKPKSAEYPELSKGPCEPGRLYNSGCSRCYCESNKKAICSKSDVCKIKGANLLTTLEAIHPLLNPPFDKDLPKLPSQAAKCDPGKAYNVDCNSCLCLHNSNLMCTKMLCLSIDDMHRINAKKHTGLPCTDLEKVKDKCIKCRCVKNKLDCEPVYGCVSNQFKLKLAHGDHPLTLSLSEEKHTCTDFFIYRDDCNLCFCRDRVLRCTQKTCIKYSQVLQLQKQRLYLEQHGL